MTIPIFKYTYKMQNDSNKYVRKGGVKASEPVDKA
jgi:hypothetical protein